MALDAVVLKELIDSKMDDYVAEYGASANRATIREGLIKAVATAVVEHLLANLDDFAGDAADVGFDPSGLTNTSATNLQDAMADFDAAIGAGGGGSSYVVTFQPSIGASTGDVKKTWAEVQTMLTSWRTAGVKGKVQFVESCSIAATTGQLTGEEWFADPNVWPTITVPNGATAVEFPNRLRSMDVLKSGTSTARYYSGPVHLDLYGVVLGASGTKPLITCSGLINLHSDTGGNNSRIDLNNSEVIEVSASEALEINLYGRNNDISTNDAIKGPVGSWLQVRRHAGNVTGVLAHSNYLGTYTTVAM